MTLILNRRILIRIQQYNDAILFRLSTYMYFSKDVVEVVEIPNLITYVSGGHLSLLYYFRDCDEYGYGNIALCNTILHEAIRCKYLNIVKFICNNAKKVDVKEIIRLAIFYKQFDMVKFLCNKYNKKIYRLIGFINYLYQTNEINNYLCQKYPNKIFKKRYC